MRSHLAIYIILSVYSVVFSQSVASDEIRIYLHPEYLTLGITDECFYDENRTRISSSVKISILDKNKIFEIEELFLKVENIESTKSDVFQHQMVIDFMVKGKIGYSVSISSNEKLKVGDGESNYYHLNQDQLVFYKNHLSFFRE